MAAFNLSEKMKIKLRFVAMTGCLFYRDLWIVIFYAANTHLN